MRNTPPTPMVGQASSPDIMMTSGDACPTCISGLFNGVLNYESPFSRGQVSNKEFRIMKFSYPLSFDIHYSLFDIRYWNPHKK